MTSDEKIPHILANLLHSYKEMVKVSEGKERFPLGWVIANSIYNIYEIPRIGIFLKDENTMPLVAHICRNFMNFLKEKGHDPLAVIIIQDAFYEEYQLPDHFLGEELNEQTIQEFVKDQEESNDIPKAKRQNCVMSALYTPVDSTLQLHPYDVIGKVVIFRDSLAPANSQIGLAQNPFLINE